MNITTQQQIIGYDAEAYAKRNKGHSPEHIRDAVWNLIHSDVTGFVLDVGCGEGGWIQQLLKCPKIQHMAGVDIVDDGASQIPNVEFYLSDVSMSLLPFKNEQLDWVFAIEVIEHLANPRHFVREACRCLKPGGRLVVSTPCNESLRAKFSFLLRGYFPAFCDHDYHVCGHITPITELDIERMKAENSFHSVNFFYPIPGLIPQTKIAWQMLFPYLKGKLWSDGLIAILVK